MGLSCEGHLAPCWPFKVSQRPPAMFLFHTDLLITCTGHTPVSCLFSYPPFLFKNTPRPCSVPLPLLYPFCELCAGLERTCGVCLVPLHGKPCPLGALWRGCPCRLLAPSPPRRVSICVAPHPACKPRGPPRSFLLLAFFKASQLPQFQKPPQLPRLLPTGAWSDPRS